MHYECGSSKEPPSSCLIPKAKALVLHSKISQGIHIYMFQIKCIRGSLCECVSPHFNQSVFSEGNSHYKYYGNLF